MNNYNNTYGLSFRDYLTNTFIATGIGVAISMVVSFVFSKMVNISFMYSGIVMFATIAELGVAMYFSFGLMKMSKRTAWLCYVIYSVLTGFSLSTIFYVYSLASVTAAFVATTVLFACMAIIGKTTDIDLSKLSGVLMSGLLAIIVSTLINTLFLHSSGIEMAISYFGVVIFLALIAYDMQRLEAFYNMTQYDNEEAEKMMIFGAFQLYLDFINLFIRIVQYLGRFNNRRN